MEKILAYKEHLLEFALIGLLIRSIAVGAGVGDSIAISSVVISICYKSFLNKNKKEESEELSKKLDDLGARVQSLQLGQNLRRPNEQKPTGRF